MSAKSAEYTRAVRKLINSKLKVQAPPPFMRGEKPRALNQPPPRQASHYDEKYLSEVRYRLFGTLHQETNIKKGNKVLKARTKGHVIGRDGYYGKEYMSVSKGVHNNNYWPGDTMVHRRKNLHDDEDWVPPDMEEINHTSWASLVDLEHYEIPEVGWKKHRTPHSLNVPHRNAPKMDEDMASIKTEEDMEAYLTKKHARDERIASGEEEATDAEKMFDHLFFTPKVTQNIIEEVTKMNETEGDIEQDRRQEELDGVEGSDVEDGQWRSANGTATTEGGDENASPNEFTFDKEEFDRIFKDGDEGVSDNTQDPK